MNKSKKWFKLAHPIKVLENPEVLLKKEKNLYYKKNGQLK